MSPPPQASLQSPPASSQLFTVRVWVEAGEGGQTAWRIKAQHVLSGETRYFHDWQALVAFLISLSPIL